MGADRIFQDGMEVRGVDKAEKDFGARASRDR
jgi:hypothetical protein